MKIFLSLLFTFFMFLAQSGNGYLGYAQQVGTSINDLITEQAIGLRYQRFVKRGVGYTIDYSYLNGTYGTSNDFKFSYFADRNGDLNIRGSEIAVGIELASKKINNVIPVGLTSGIRIGPGFYNYGQGLKTQLILETYVRQTYNIYDRLNAYFGFGFGQNVTFSDEQIRVKKGLNKNYVLSSTAQKQLDNFYININYGIAIMF